MKILVSQVIAILILAGFLQPVRAAEIAVLMSSDAAAYQEALLGFREAVPNRSVKVQLLTNRVEDRENQLKIIRSVIEPDIIYVIGTPALQALVGKITHIPIVHAMVFNPQPGTITDGKKITGVSMIPASAETMALIKELNPKIHRVGVMYDPARSSALYAQAQSAAQKAKIQLVGRKIQSPGEIAAALKAFINEVDLLWLWPDERFLANDILQRIFLFSFEHKIPVLGLSELQTERGALLSLSYGSAKDMGKQAAELVNRILEQKMESLAPLAMPRKFKLTVNLKTARKLDIEVPDSIIRRADNAVKAPVYKEGDWWVFRIKVIDPNGATKTEVHRVMFSKDKFTSDDPSFLSGGDVPGSPYFLPFASVYLTDPARRWLDFPLLPGKTWSFRYFATASGWSGGPHHALFRYVDAEAEVVGKAFDPIKTPAGQFTVIEIARTDDSHNTLTYYYSPRSQSVVKLRAEVPGLGKFAGQFELELLGYGNGGNMGKDLR